jgi:hypothetical protein
MKRFIGLLLALAGGAAALWGGYHTLVGEVKTRLTITPDFAPTAMTVGLVGLAVATVGVVWTRD